MTSIALPEPLRMAPDGRSLDLLDQTRLPTEERVLRLRSAEGVAEAIRALRVRGAPAIGVAGAYGLAVEMVRAVEGGEADLPARFRAAHGLLLATRPTGRDLGWALERMAKRFEALVSGGAGGEAVAEGLLEEARAVHEREDAMCRALGEAGSDLLPEDGARVLTHCNTGALATASVGTAVAPVYLAAARGLPVRVLACETRPVLQGARLTAWELARAGIPTVVITDSTAGAAMAAGRVDLVIVGADRIAANGDVANKIGTYALAVLARHHGLPFYVAAPRSTFDGSVPDGSAIPIEERDSDEIRSGFGRPTVPGNAEVWNPAFDVTPAHLVTAFVTDGGVLRPPYGPAVRRLLEERPAREAVA